MNKLALVLASGVLALGVPASLGRDVSPELGALGEDALLEVGWISERPARPGVEDMEGVAEFDPAYLYLERRVM